MIVTQSTFTTISFAGGSIAPLPEIDELRFGATYAAVIGAAAAAPPAITNSPATGITTTTAALNAALSSAGTNVAVSAYWNTVNGGTNAALWTNSAYVGSWTNVASTSISYTATGLAPNTTYYFAFRATNSAYNVWATNVLSFTTLPPPLVISGMAFTGAGMAAIAGSGASGQTFVLTRSFDLAAPSSSWTPVQTNSHGIGVFNFSIPVGTEPSVYFRVFAY